MHFRKIIPAIILFFFSFYCFGQQEVVIYGNAPDYAGDDLIFFKYSNLITKKEIPVDTALVDSAGNFSLWFELNNIQPVYTHVGVYLCYLYVTPGKRYEVILPKKQEKKHAEKFNPFFSETEVHLAIKNFSEKDLNFSIRAFNQSYLPYYNKHVYDLFVRHNFNDLDSAIIAMEAPFHEDTSTYFAVYRKYKLARLRYLANQRKSKRISDQFFLHQKVMYHNDAYMELFNKVYDDYFTYFGRTDEGNQIFDDVSNKQSLSMLKKTLNADNVLSNDTLKEVVILKSIHDEFYKDKFSRSALLTILDSLRQTTLITEHKKIAADIREKITRLLAGHVPPQFSLYNRDSILMDLSVFKGRYVYLNFCSCQSYSCINEFNILDEFFARHKEHVTIVTIVLDESYGSMVRFLDRWPFPWTFLHYANTPELIKEYDIRGFPTYFLIGPDGKLILSPAPSPSEGFGERLFYIMKQRGDL